MRCHDVEMLCSDYVDGELDQHRANALRGHLRVCPRCLARVEDEAALRDAAADLEPLEPPAALWEGIEARLAAAEIGDAQRSRLWMWWQAWRSYAMPAAVVAVAALALVVWSQHRPETAPERDTPAPAPAPLVAAPGDVTPPAPVADGPSFLEQRSAEIAQADRDYVSVVDDLKQIIADERTRWSAAEAAAFDRGLAEFEAAARQHRQQLAVNQLPEPASRDALYEVYRAEIGFLQQAALGGGAMVATRSGGVLP